MSELFVFTRKRTECSLRRRVSQTLTSRENVLHRFPDRRAKPLRTQGDCVPLTPSCRIFYRKVIFIKGRQPKEKRPTITIRLDQPEKDKIERLAKQCGLSVTEYLILRGTGYEPKIVPYDAVFTLIKRLDELIDKDISPEVNAEAMTVLKAVTASLVYPKKEGRDDLLQQQDCGL